MLEVGSTVPMAGGIFDSPQVSVDEAVQSTYPWAVRPFGATQWCRLKYWRSPEEGDNDPSHTYVCQSNVRDFVIDPNTFFQTHAMLEMQLNTDVKVVFLKAVSRPTGSGQIWTAQRTEAGGAQATEVDLEDVFY